MGWKEYTWDFWRRMHLNTTNDATDYFHSFFADHTDSVYVDGATETGQESTVDPSSLYGYSFPNQACLSLGHLWIQNGGRFRVMPVEVPPLTYNANVTGTVEIGETLTSSTMKYMNYFREGEFIGTISPNYTHAMMQRDISLQTLGMGAQVLLVTRTMVVERGGILTARSHKWS